MRIRRIWRGIAPADAETAKLRARAQVEKALPEPLTYRIISPTGLLGRGLRTGRRRASRAWEEIGMKRVWRRPTIRVIAVGLEINSYACAEVDK
jgi:coenzyme PQQ precursor peptide PqqA